MTGPLPLKLAFLVVCVGLLAGCGHTQGLSADQTVHIALSEYRLNPDNVRVGSGDIDFHVHNYGRLTHDLVITHGGQAAGSTGPLYPGQSLDLTMSLAPGTYSMASTIHSDEALGAYGTLKVTG